MEIEHDSDFSFDEDLFDVDSGMDVEDEISIILTDMNLSEKVGQMTQIALGALSAPGAEEIDPERLRDAIVHHHVGAVFNFWTSAMTPEEWHDVVATIQEVALLETRLGIPVIYGIDSIHGASYVYGATLFPHNLGLAATWNPTLVSEVASANARETSACGIPWIFAPVLDLGRHPAWSRFFETFGEDVCLATRMARAAAEGYLRHDDAVAACAKHFVGYGYPRSGLDRTAAAIPMHELRELFLPPFKAAVGAGIQSIMVNSGVLNGEPVHASRRLLTGLLREELGFEGVILSDWEDVIKLHTVHRVAASEKEAARLAVEAGIDVSMTPHSLSFAHHLTELVEEGALPEERIDASVRRILRLKHRLGLFDHPFPDAEEISRIGAPETIDLSYRTAVAGITLLKNEGGLLPLSKQSRILVTGPASNSVAALHGPWSYTWQGADEDAYPEGCDTVASAIAETFGSKEVTHIEGIDWGGDVDAAEAVRAAADVDVVVLCLGERPSVEKPGDIDDLTLSDEQIEFARRLAASGTPVVLVLLEDRPRVIRAIEPLCAAVVLAYRPGPEGGRAVSAILAGKENPSGKLPFTYPRHPNGLLPYDRLQSETIGREFGMDGATAADPFDPQFPFGFGLSYTRFTYRNLLVTPTTAGLDDVVTVSVDVKNAGKRAGREVVQLYVSDEFASLPPPVKRLKDFRPVELKAGESATIRFELPVSALGFTDLEGVVKAEPGKFSVIVGDLSASLEVQ